MQDFENTYKLAKENLKQQNYQDAILNFKECVDKHFYKLKKTQVILLNDEIKDAYYQVAFIVAGNIKLYDTRDPFTSQETLALYKSIGYLDEALHYDPFNTKFIELFRIVLLYLAKFENNPKDALTLLLKIQTVDPHNSLLQYNIGHKYQMTNDFTSAICHYKLCIGICKGNSNQPLHIKCLNGLGAIYFNVQRRDLAKFYFEMAYSLDPEDPDINNQLGVVYTDLRYSKQAIFHYNKCIENASKAIISQDKNTLLASTYMNMGLVYTYTGNVLKGIECSNTSLKHKPGFSLAFQNKLLDINYISNLVDPDYIFKLHTQINKCFPRVKTICDGYTPKNSGAKLRIGFLSGDFICHPVSYFTSCIFDNLDTERFEMYCYSTKVIKTDDRFPRPIWKTVRNMPCKNLTELIKNDCIDILVDLSGNTGDNRMDVLAEKPAPVIINAIGYPNTTGL